MEITPTGATTLRNQQAFCATVQSWRPVVLQLVRAGSEPLATLSGPGRAPERFNVPITSSRSRIGSAWTER